MPAKIKHTRPTLNRETVELIKRKQQAWGKFTTIHEEYKLFCRIRNKVRKLTRYFAAQRQKQVTENIKENPKAFWNYLSSKRHNQPSTPTLIDPLSGKTLEDPNEKANLLNYHFASVLTTQLEDRSEAVRIEEENVS